MSTRASHSCHGLDGPCNRREATSAAGATRAGCCMADGRPTPSRIVQRPPVTPREADCLPLNDDGFAPRVSQCWTSAERQGPSLGNEGARERAGDLHENIQAPEATEPPQAPNPARADQLAPPRASSTAVMRASSDSRLPAPVACIRWLWRALGSCDEAGVESRRGATRRARPPWWVA